MRLYRDRADILKNSRKRLICREEKFLIKKFEMNLYESDVMMALYPHYRLLPSRKEVWASEISGKNLNYS